MPTVIDSLVLEFNLDTSQFTREQERLLNQIRKMSETARNQAVDLEGSMKRTIGVFSNLQRMGLASVAGFLGFKAGEEIVHMVDHFARLDQSVSRLSGTLQMSKQDIFAWRNAFRAAGFTPEGGLDALKSINAQVMGAVQFGEMNPLRTMAARMGIDLQGAGGKPITGQDMMIRMAEWLDQSGMNKQQREAYLQRSGLPAEAIGMLTQKSAPELQKLLAEQRKLFPSDDDTKKFDKFIEQLGNITTAFEQLGMAITDKVAPGLTAFAAWLTKWLEEHGFTDEQTGQWATYLGSGAVHDYFAKIMSPTLKSWIGFDSGRGGAAARSENDAEREAFIRKTAQQFNLDPEMVVQTWNAEGRAGLGERKKSTFPGEESFGDFQLNMLPGSLGTLYQKETGHMPGDPRYWREEDAWAIKQMRFGKEGMRPWHGWHGPAGAGGAGGGAGQHVSINIQKMDVHGHDAHEVASNLSTQLRRQQIALLGNQGAV